MGPEAGVSAVVVGVDDPGQLVVVDDRERQGELAAVLGARLEEVGLRTDRRRDGGDDFLADRVERRVRDLREQLLEVVEQQPRPFRQHGDRCVGSHRADRLGAVERHRGDDDLELLVRVPEHLLAAQHAVMAEHDVLALGQIDQLGHALLEPLGVRVLGGERALDLLVVDDATLGGVDQEHLAGLQPALGDDLGRIDVDHPDLGRHHDEVVVGDPVAAGPKTVAVEHGADHGAIGERHAGGAVPGLHHARVVPVERPLVVVHLGVVLPRLGDHHQDRVLDRTSGQVQQLEHLVEAGRVRRAGRADRERLGEVRQVRARRHRLAGAHPVLVALDGVDLAVVGDEAVRMGKRPRRERVGREARVHEQQRALDTRIDEVREELAELRCRQHPLVDDRAGRQRREVRREVLRQFVLGTLAGNERLAVEFDTRGAVGGGDEELLHRRHRRPGGRAEALGAGRQVAPAEHDEPLLHRDVLDRGECLLECHRLGRQEGDARRVRTFGREREPGDSPQEPVGYLEQDAGTVAGVGLGPGRATVGQVGERPKPGHHEFVRPHAPHVGDERDATGVMFEARVVKARRPRLFLHRWLTSTKLEVAVEPGTTLAQTVASCYGIARWIGKMIRHVRLRNPRTVCLRTREASSGADRSEGGHVWGRRAARRALRRILPASSRSGSSTNSNVRGTL